MSCRRVRPRTTFLVPALSLIILSSQVVILAQHKEYAGIVLHSPVTSQTAIRFYAQSNGDVLQEPLVIRPVEPSDPRLNTAPITEDGQTTFVSEDEMSQLLKKLAQSDLHWKESKKVKAIEPYRGPNRFDDRSDDLDIEVVTLAGTAQAKVKPTETCETLGQLNLALQTPRALLEFQAFRHWDGCEVPGFDFIRWQSLNRH